MAAIHINQTTLTAPQFGIGAPKISVPLQRLRWIKKVAPSEEKALLEFIAQPAPHAERSALLLQKWENGGVSDEEGAEMVSLLCENEAHNTQQTQAVLRLSELRSQTFEATWNQVMKTPAPLPPGPSRFDD